MHSSHRAAYRTILGVLSILLFGCSAAPVKETPGPATAESMDPSGGFPTQYVTTSRREGARQPFILLHPDHPFASVILFTGGTGVASISPHGIRRGGNFLVRSRTLFAEQGLMVAVVDPPSDRGTLNGFRTSQAHALDIKGVIAYLREQAPVPVWLVGTSYGTVSATKVADWLADGGGPDGIVLTSSLFSKGPFGDSVYDADPARIRIPMLIVHHESDRCRSTPFALAQPYVQRMTHASPGELIAVNGGGQSAGTHASPSTTMATRGSNDRWSRPSLAGFARIPLSPRIKQLAGAPPAQGSTPPGVIPRTSGSCAARASATASPPRAAARDRASRS